MASFYALMLFGLSALVLVLMLQCLISLTREAFFYGDRRRKLELVLAEERRQQQLPYIGIERRHTLAAARTHDAEHKRA